MKRDVEAGAARQEEEDGFEPRSAADVKITTLSTGSSLAGASPAALSIQPISLIFTPADAYRSFQASGLARVNGEYFTLAVMGLVAGLFIAIGVCFSIVAGATTGVALVGALAFPTGILLTILWGGDFFTDNICYMFTAHLEGQANWWHHIKHLVGPYFYNLVGCLLVVGLCLGGRLWDGLEDLLHAPAHAKMALGWGVVVCRAIVANWLVTLATWQAFCARDVVGKAVGCWIPATCFMCLGLEHSIVNMFIIPMSIYLDPTEKYPNTITWAAFIRKNLIPTTIGNWLGGAIVVGVLGASIHGRNIPRWKNMAWDATLGKVIPKLP